MNQHNAESETVAIELETCHFCQVATVCASVTESLSLNDARDVSDIAQTVTEAAQGPELRFRFFHFCSSLFYFHIFFKH